MWCFFLISYKLGFGIETFRYYSPASEAYHGICVYKHMYIFSKAVNLKGIYIQSNKYMFQNIFIHLSLAYQFSVHSVRLWILRHLLNIVRVVGLGVTYLGVAGFTVAGSGVTGFMVSGVGLGVSGFGVTLDEQLKGRNWNKLKETQWVRRHLLVGGEVSQKKLLGVTIGNIRNEVFCYST